MKRYTLTVKPRSSLFIGGYAQAAGESDGDTARDKDGMLIPGSAVRGALREAATRLVRGAGRGHELLETLFGVESLSEGVLRLGPFRACDGRGEPLETDDLPDLTLRHHVSLERATRQAAPGRLFQNRVTTAGFGMVFRGELTARRELDEDEIGLLRSALLLADQLGGGRGRGLGHVELELEESPASESVAPSAQSQLESLPDHGILTLVLRAEEPLQLGVIKDLGNVHTSNDFLDGSAVRGAVAASLGYLGHDDALDLVLGGEAPAVFGNGYPGHPSSVPAPLTLREPKGDGSLIDSALYLCHHAVTGSSAKRLHGYRAAKGSFAYGNTGWYKIRPRRRMITRTARNLAEGRAADGKLFTLEVLEPRLEPSPVVEDGQLRFYVPVSGRREQLEWVVRAARQGLEVGGCRGRGFGRLRLESVSTEPAIDPLAERHKLWTERLARHGVDRPERTGVLLALGPVALDPARLIRAFCTAGLELVHGVSRRRTHGGWNRRAGLPRTVSSHFVPGSVWIVENAEDCSALGALEKLEMKGLGPGRADGWGRVVACHPIHLDCSKEESR